MTSDTAPDGWTVRRPRLAWRDDGAPESLDFADTYAARADAAGEVRHVLLDGLGAPAVWNRPGPFVIGETGFGTGLNLLVTWDLWRRTAPADARLHWVSVEACPLRRVEAVRALARMPALTDLARRLLAVWPPAVPGVHARPLDDCVTLTLALGLAEEALPVLAGGVDAWALDGFAPARNPDMWRPAVLAEVGRLSRPGARLATYSSAGAVRHGLAAAGVSVTRARGFAGKRDCLRGTYQGPGPAPPAAAPKWTAPPPPLPAGARVAVVGAGIAGCAVAATLRRCGVGPVTVIDARGHPRDSLPESLLALLEPRLEKDASPAARLHAAAALAAVALYDDRAAAGADPWRGPRGLVSADRGRRDDAWRRAVTARMDWPGDWLRLLDRAEAGAWVGLDPPGATALGHPQGGCLAQAALLPALLGDTPVLAATVARIEPAAEGGGWRLRDADGRVLAEADAVVLASAMETARLWPAAALPLRPTRGQVSLLRAAGPGAPPRVAVSSGAYVTPPVADGAGGWWRVMGATHTPWRDPAATPFAVTAADDGRIRAALAAAWPDLAEALAGEPTVGALAGLRATTPDHLPLAGPLFDAAALAATQGDALRRGGAGAGTPMPGPAGLFTVCGLGSHGLVMAPLAAALVAAQMTGTPWPLPAQPAAALHPARFAVRALVRGRDPLSAG